MSGKVYHRVETIKDGSKLNRFLLCIGLPFAICVIAPSLLGALLVGESKEIDNVIFVVVGVFIVLVFPLMGSLLWFVSRTPKVLKPTN
jgi:hypothetical protein